MLAVSELSSACSPIGPSAHAGTIAPKNVLTIGVPDSVQTLNPVTMATPFEADASAFVWQGLLGVNAGGSLFPVLAKSVPTIGNGLITPNGRTITIDLRPNLQWSDGKMLTSEDVRFGWKLAINRLADLCPATCSVIKNVVPKSTTQVVFQLRRPYSPLLFDLPPVLPRHQMWHGSWRSTFDYLYQATSNYMTPRFPVDGPYQVLSSTTTTTTFAPNPHWTIMSRPGYKRVVFEAFQKDSDMIAAQRSGQVQISQGYFNLDFFRRILNPSNLAGLHFRLLPFGGVEHLEPNLLGRWQPDPAHPGKYVFTAFLRDPRVRQAISLAIDRKQLLMSVFGLSASQATPLVAYGPENPGRFDGIAVHGAWDPIKQRFVTSPQLADARRLLEMAGWRLRANGLRYRNSSCDPSHVGCELNLLLLAPNQDAARLQETIQLGADLRKVGINLISDVLHWGMGNLIASYRERGPCSRGWDDVCLFAQVAGFDPQTDYQFEFSSSHIARLKKTPQRTDINYTGVRDPIINSIFGQSADSYRLRARARLYRQWQVEVARNADWISIFHRPVIMIVRGRVRNLDPSAGGLEWNPWALAPSR